MISCLKMSSSFFLYFALKIFLVLNISIVQSEIQTQSIDYWIGNISPRCAINIIYFNFTTDFSFTSTYHIPVIFIPLAHDPTLKARDGYFKKHKFYNASLRFMKSECYFSLIYYKIHPNLITTSLEDLTIIDTWISNIAYGFLYWPPYESNVTYCVVLYHGVESKVGSLTEWIGFRPEISLALIYLSPNRLNHGYTVYCRTPSTTVQVAGTSNEHDVISHVDQEFMDSCSNQFTVVGVAEQYQYNVYDPLLLVTEHEVITKMFSKINVSITSRSKMGNRYDHIPLILLNNNQHSFSFFQTFDNSIRIFTCYSAPFLSFHFYISAFEKRVWISVIVTGMLLAAFLNWHIHRNINKKLSFSSMLFYFSIFMEEPYSIPLSIRNNKVYRTASILWLLTAIVLTNTYVSHVISELNAPLNGENLSNIDDLSTNKSNVTPEEIFSLDTI